jgi:hypothetical protein
MLLKNMRIIPSTLIILCGLVVSVVAQPKPELKRTTVSFGYGFSYRTASPRANEWDLPRDYLAELKSGTSMLGSFTYYFTNNFGLGFLYTRFTSSHHLANVGLYDAANTLISFGSLEDNIAISCYGPMVELRKPNAPGTLVLTGAVGLGFLSSLDLRQRVLYYEVVTGNSVGALGAAGIDLVFNTNVALSLEATGCIGTISKFKIDDEPYAAAGKENVNRLELNLGIKLYL